MWDKAPDLNEALSHAAVGFRRPPVPVCGEAAPPFAAAIAADGGRGGSDRPSPAAFRRRGGGDLAPGTYRSVGLSTASTAAGGCRSDKHPLRRADEVGSLREQRTWRRRGPVCTASGRHNRRGAVD